MNIYVLRHLIRNIRPFLITDPLMTCRVYSVRFIWRNLHDYLHAFPLNISEYFIRYIEYLNRDSLMWSYFDWLISMTFGPYCFRLKINPAELYSFDKR